ncbi:MAG: hypothetical protein EXX96DRAFT_584915 [Benjaminiella poitrasii]|nr:MAG: hypothetical protein EXX96DRAFT_584915 [Benjaminiella poitrasii]
MIYTIEKEKVYEHMFTFIFISFNLCRMIAHTQKVKEKYTASHFNPKILEFFTLVIYLLIVNMMYAITQQIHLC